jgi:uncharacterized protein (TIGR03067 family)
MALLLVSFTGLLLVGSRTPAEDKKDAGGIDGKWELVASTADGKEAEPEELANRFMVVKGDKATFLYKDKERAAAVVKLDASKSPKQIDSTYLDGPAKGVTLKGIYKVEGDKLTICYGGFGKERPGEFASTAGSGAILTVLKRA